MYDHLRPDRGLDSPSALGRFSVAEDTWAGDLRRAADWLALGSVCLFLWFVPFLDGWACVPIYLVAIGLHGVGWYFLGAGALRAPGILRAASLVFFAASLGAFAYSLLFIVPGEPGVLRLLFPVLPEVWVPVVACHAAQFLLAGTAMRDDRAARWIAAGVVVLVGLVAGGAAVWTLGMSESPAYLVLLLPGLTAVGYVFLRIGLRLTADAA